MRPKIAQPLILQKCRSAAKIASLLAKYYWKESLPMIAHWSAGPSNQQEIAAEALAAEVPYAALRGSRTEMLALLRDHKSPKELRHQLAIKIGLSSKDEDVAALLKEYRSLSEPEDKIFFEAALFATHNRQVAPVLIQYAKENPAPVMRAGARVELQELLDPKSYHEFVQWVVKNDPDDKNREDAAKELALLDKPFPAQPR